MTTVSSISEAIAMAAELIRSGRADIAEHLLQQVLAASPGHPVAFRLLGMAARSRGDNESAIRWLEPARDMLPGQGDLSRHLALAYLATGRLDDALRLGEAAREECPTDGGIVNALGLVRAAMNDWRGALEAFDAAARLAPQEAEIRHNLANALLVAGDYERGWPEFEWRRRLARFTGHQPDTQEWRGEDLAGKTLLILGEQGFGDTIQFIRYAPLCRRSGAKVVIAVRPQLIRLFQTSFPWASVVSVEGETLPAHDRWCYVMDLPARFATTVSTVPADAYLTPPPPSEWR
ncbi:MAG: tetratricopeptide repeat protein, partial [Pseudomonadota bacterium]